MDITVVLTSCGRSQELLEEAVYSFLFQEYPCKKLLLVNIHPTPVIFEHPDVEIHNIKPFDYYGQQVYYALSQIKTPLWTVFDSDDLMLPWHLKNLYKNYQKQTVHPCRVSHKQMWFSTKNRILRLARYNWTCCLYDALTEDMLDVIEKGSKCWMPDGFIFKQNFFEARFFCDSLPGTIYRKNLEWSISTHLDRSFVGTCEDIIKQMPGCKGVLNPHWRKDYVKEVINYAGN
ncbi:hypothetical protein LCGC14_1314660 [marine sediment metagenome]|uniref:Glycosyltransferase 2-like domain-containing protein n=1 Tax=marine sediment metagenome TaxID=412755 RepID=A0A0F9KLA0_9ZZZZ